MALHKAYQTSIVLVCLPVIALTDNNCIRFNTFATCTDIIQVASLPSSIETLVLNGVSTDTLPEFTFSHLSHLRELNIQSTNIKQANRDAFSHLPSLSLLSISNSELTVVKTGAFRGLHGLSSLDISRSTVDVIEIKAFSDIEGVNDFTIKNNNISTINSMAFFNISAITSFQFSENKVSVVRANAFSEWSHVMSSIIDSNTFGRLECLTDLSPAVVATLSFYRNYLECDCYLAWMLISSVLRDKLLSNKCHIPGTQESLGMSIVSLRDLLCPVNPSSVQMGCPGAEWTSVTFNSEVKLTTSSSLSSVSFTTPETTSEIPLPTDTDGTLHKFSTRGRAHITPSSFSVFISSGTKSVDTSPTEYPTLVSVSSGYSTKVGLKLTNALALLITVVISTS